MPLPTPKPPQVGVPEYLQRQHCASGTAAAALNWPVLPHPLRSTPLLMRRTDQPLSQGWQPTPGATPPQQLAPTVASGCGGAVAAAAQTQTQVLLLPAIGAASLREGWAVAAASRLVGVHTATTGHCWLLLLAAQQRCGMRQTAAWLQACQHQLAPPLVVRRFGRCASSAAAHTWSACSAAAMCAARLQLPGCPRAWAAAANVEQQLQPWHERAAHGARVWWCGICLRGLLLGTCTCQSAA